MRLSKKSQVYCLVRQLRRRSVMSFTVIRVEVTPRTGDEKEFPQQTYASSDEAFSHATSANDRVQKGGPLFFIVRNAQGDLLYTPQRVG